MFVCWEQHLTLGKATKGAAKFHGNRYLEGTQSMRNYGFPDKIKNKILNKYGKNEGQKSSVERKPIENKNVSTFIVLIGKAHDK